MKRIIFYLTALVLFANLGYAQNDTLYVMKNNDIISQMPVDSVDKINLDTQNSTLYIYNGTSLLGVYSKYDVDSVVFERPEGIKNDYIKADGGYMDVKLFGKFNETDEYAIIFGPSRELFGTCYLEHDGLVFENGTIDEHFDIYSGIFDLTNEYYYLSRAINTNNCLFNYYTYLRFEIRRDGELLRAAEWIK